MLGEEVAVHDLDEAVELLDGQAAHGHVEDELGEELAAHTGKAKNPSSKSKNPLNHPSKNPLKIHGKTTGSNHP